MSACCCGDDCQCDTTVCHTFYIIQFKKTTIDCTGGDYPCAGGSYYYSGLHYSDSCTPPTAADILALYKAGSVSGCPAEGDVGSCSDPNPSVQIQNRYPSCTLISSVQNQICAQTYSYPSVGPFHPYNQRDPTQIPPANQLAYNLFYGQTWKQENIPDPSCGDNFDIGVFGVSFTTPPCRDSVGCCP